MKTILSLIALFMCGWLCGYYTPLAATPPPPQTDTILVHDTLTLHDTITIAPKQQAFIAPSLNDIELKCKVTYYQPTAGQCSGNPLKTADGSLIDINLLNANKLRWCAVSPDIWKLLPKDNKRIHISGYIDGYNGWYEVHDKTASRHSKLVDILAPVKLPKGVLHTKHNIKIKIPRQ